MTEGTSSSSVSQGLACYPRRKLGAGAIFDERYAESFYAAHPEWTGKPFSKIKMELPNDPVVQACMHDFVAELHEWRKMVDEWETKWPDAAALLRQGRERESRARKERKRFNSEVSMQRERLRIKELEWILSRSRRRTVPATLAERLNKARDELVDAKRRLMRLQDAFRFY